jgi:hypothetical protein
MPAGTQVRGNKYDYKVLETLDGFAIPESLDYDPDRSGYLRMNGENVEKFIFGTGWLPIAGANNYPTTLVYDLGQLTLGRNGLSDLSVTIDKAALGLGNVEDVALSTWAGSDNITNVGVITDGVWNGMAISPLKGGVPPGGTTGQVIKKLSATDYDVAWGDEDGVGGGSSAWGDITGTLSDQIDLITALNAKQPIDADLTAIAGLTPSNDDIIQRKAGAWTNRTLAQYKVDLAINNIDNTSDINKPVSTAQAAAIALKNDLLVSGTNIKTINGSSILGSGNITISGGTSYTFSDGLSETGGAVIIPTNGITSAKINAGAVNDSKISDVAWAKITGTPTTVGGYGITDAVTLTGTQTITNKTINGANNTLSNLALTALVQGGAALNQVLRWNGSVWAPSDETSGGTSYIFTPSDFNNLAGTISIDYANGQASSASTKGFLTAADWLSFNSKQNQITTGSTAQYFRGDLSLATFPTNISTFVNDSGYLVNITGKISAGTNITITGLGTTASPYVITSTASGLTDGDKGDITVTASGSSWVVDALAITNAKINDVAWGKITGTPTTVAGYGITDAVTLTGTQTLTNKTLTSPKINVGADATGDVYFRDGSGNLVRLAIGSTGQVLKVVSGLPAWAADATGGGGGSTLTDGDYGDVTVSATGTAIFIDNGVVSNAKLANVATATMKGRVTASTGVVEDLTGTQVTTLLDIFTSTLKGLVPLSGGGTTNFLRADGTWAAPSGGTTYTFTAADFNESGTTISIDYSNGQAATTSLKGFLTSADWNTFNHKQNAITTGTTSQYFRGDLSLATFPTNVSTFTNDAAYLQNITGKVTAGTNVSITGSGTTASPYVISATESGETSELAGTTNRITISGTTTTVIDISGAYAGQSSINTLGTVTSGVWNGSVITDTYISSASTWNAKLSNITGLITAGTNVSITGSGTSGSPYVVNATGGGTYTGTANRISIAGSVIDIASTYLGQSSITTLGTIASGVWNATPIGTTKGGVPTGGTAGQILAKINGTDYNTQWIPAPTLELVPGYGILIDGENNISVDPDILTGGGGISDLTGDIYASGAGSVVATIQPNAVDTGKIADASVTNAKIVSVAWSKITSTPTTVSGYGITDAVTLTGTQTITNKTLTSPKINVGSDATGDIYYRDASGNLVRLALGSNGQVLKITSGLPAWGTDISGGGGVTDGTYADIAISSTGSVYTITAGAVTNSKVATGIDAVKLADGSVTNAELQYINSLTSNAQDQINSKQATLVAGTNIKTINGVSPLGSGDLTISGSVSMANNRILARYAGTTGAGQDAELSAQFDLSSGGVLSSSDYVTVMQFGGVEDGTTDASIAFQSAVDTGKPVMVFGSVKLNSTIDIPSGSRIYGFNPFTSKLITTTNAPVLEIQGAFVRIQDIEIQGNAAGSSQHGIYIPDLGDPEDKKHIVINNVRLNGLHNGIYGINNNGGIRISDSHFEDCVNGIYYEQYCEYNTLTNSTVRDCTTGLRIIGGNNSMTGGSIRDCDTAVYLGNGTNDSHGMFTGVFLNHNTIGVHADGVTFNYLFSGCMIYYSNITINNSTGVKFLGGDISTSAITITSSTDTEFNSVTFVGDGTNTLSITSSPSTNFINNKGAVPSGMNRYATFFNGPLAGSLELVNTQSRIRVRSTDPTQYSGISLDNSNEYGISVFATDVSYSPTGAFTANTGLVDSYAPGGLVLMARDAVGVINFYSGGYTSDKFAGQFKADQDLYLTNLDDETGVAKMVTVTDGVLGYDDIPSGGGGGSLDDVLNVGNVSSVGFSIPGDKPTFPAASFNAFNIQPIEYNSNILGFNAYYNGGWRVKEAGLGSFIQAVDDGVYIGSTTSGSAGGTVTSTYIANFLATGIRFHSAYTFPITVGSANQVLAMPASGDQLVWVDPGGGGSQDLQEVTDIGATSTNTVNLTNLIPLAHYTSGYASPFTFGGTISNTTTARVIQGSGAGYWLQGFSNSSLTPGAKIQGYVGSASPTVAPVIIEAYKFDGGTSSANIGSSELAFVVSNGAHDAGSPVHLLRLNGDGGLVLNATKYGTSGAAKMMTVNNGLVSFDDIPGGGGGGMTNPMTTAGDLIVGESSGTPGRLGIGANGTYLKSNGSAASWSNFQTDVRAQFSAGSGIDITSGVISAIGGGQDATYTVLTAITTNTAETAMTGSMPISNGEAGTLEITVYAVNSTNTGSWTRKLIVPYRGTSSTTCVFETHTNLNPAHAEGSGMADNDIAYTYNGSGDFIMSVFGTGSTAIQWRAEIKKYSVYWSS